MDKWSMQHILFWVLVKVVMTDLQPLPESVLPGKVPQTRKGLDTENPAQMAMSMMPKGASTTI
jgi:hypothetical protein